MSWSALAAITKYYRLCSLKDRHLFLISGGWESKIKVLEDLVPGESFLSGLQMAAIFLCPLMMGLGESERESSDISC